MSTSNKTRRISAQSNTAVVNKKPIGLKTKAITTHICFIVDKSGSMEPNELEYVSMYNQQVADHQEKAVGEALGTLVFFNHEVRPQFQAEPLENMRPITVQEYAPGGLTAMFDAVGQTVTRLRQFDDNRKNVSFLVIVLSDGLENSSREWGGARLQSLIRELEGTGRWTFQYIGCSGEALKQAKNVGLSNAVKFEEGARGTQLLNASMKLGNSRLWSTRAGGQSLGNMAYLSQGDLDAQSGDEPV